MEWNPWNPLWDEEDLDGYFDEDDWWDGDFVEGTGACGAFAYEDEEEEVEDEFVCE